MYTPSFPPIASRGFTATLFFNMDDSDMVSQNVAKFNNLPICVAGAQRVKRCFKLSGVLLKLCPGLFERWTALSTG